MYFQLKSIYLFKLNSMNNDTNTNHENYKEVSNVDVSYLGMKRQSDTEFDKTETGKYL